MSHRRSENAGKAPPTNSGSQDPDSQSQFLGDFINMGAAVRDFHHPYKPYNIQVELMTAIYDCITGGKIGIFESPTGTGKSLSLICSSLSWLRDVQREKLGLEVVGEKDDEEPTWVVEHAKVEKLNAITEQRLELEARLRWIREKESNQKQRYENGEPRAKRMRIEHPGTKPQNDGEALYELNDYDSEEESSKINARCHSESDQGLSSTSKQLMEKLGLNFKVSSEERELPPIDELKIYFCSRTHSQLTQIVHEIRRVNLPPLSWRTETNHPPNEESDIQVIKHVPLGSRKNLCINPEVLKLRSAPAINERCLELQQPDTQKDRKCPFVPTHENESLVNDFRDHTIAKVRDIEDLTILGKKIGVCPYYASRATVKPAEVKSPISIILDLFLC